jgi:hypothetical protein
LSRDTENEKKLSMATTGTISLKDKDIEQARSKPDGYHGYHECSSEAFGLQMDSITPLSHSVGIHANGCNV